MEKETKKEQKKATHVVKEQFEDATEYQDGEKKTYEIGEDVSHFDEARLSNLIERGIVTKTN